MNSSITIARVFGIPIRIELTWLIIFAVLLIPGGLYYLPNQYPHWSPVAVWTVAGLYTVLFFASILLHELAHSLVAKLNGIPVQSITLWLFGGVAHLTKAADRPRTEALISIVGPGVNLVIGAALFVYLYLIGANNEYVEVLGAYLLGANAILAIFNLMPGLPLDGGQLVRSAVWAVTHNREKGTVYASLGGCGVAILVCAGGVSMVYFLGPVVERPVARIHRFLDASDRHRRLQGGQDARGNEPLLGVSRDVALHRSAKPTRRPANSSQRQRFGRVRLYAPE